MAANTYTKLVEERKQIRLVKIEPGSFEDAIHVRLSVACLEDQLVYQALSYTWGDPNITAPISLDDKPFQVTTNMEAALRRLRSNREPRIMWIDAICINQEDMAERSSQVKLMGEIYKNSTKTILWLGEEDEETKPAMCILKSWARDEHLMESEDFHPDQMPFIGNLMKRPWWTRVWTIQETILSPVKDIVVGSFSIPWEDLKNAFHNSHRHKFTCCLLRHQQLQDVSRWVQGHQTINEFQVAENHTGDLFALLTYFRRRQSTDPRDKIYGFLSLGRGVLTDFIVPQYGWDTSLVYSNLMTAAIKSEGDLKRFGLIGTKRVDNGFVLPSWVVDWTSTDHDDHKAQLDRNALYRLYDACGMNNYPDRGAKGDCYDIGGRYVLKEEGIYFDEVSAVGVDLENASGSDFTEMLQTMYEQWSNLAAIDGRKTYFGSEDLGIAIARTIIRDAARPSHDSNMRRRATNEDIQQFQDVWDKWLRREPDFDFMDHMLSFLTPLITFQKLFITMKGYIGIGPTTVQPGNKVYILTGGRMPLLVKNLEGFDIEAEHGAMAVLVGPAYIHGIMDGEAAADFDELSKPMMLI